MHHVLERMHARRIDGRHIAHSNDQHLWLADDGPERVLYIAALLSVAGGFALLVAPSIHHRIRFRNLDKESHHFRASRLVIAASGLLAFATAATVDLVLSTITGEPLAAVLAGGVAAWFIWFWYGLAFRAGGSDR